MPKSVPMLDPVGALSPADLFYVVQGAGLDRDRKVTAEELATYVLGRTRADLRSAIQVTGSTEQTLDTTNLYDAVVVVAGTVPSLVLSGTPELHSRLCILNGTSSELAVSSTSGVIALPHVAVADVMLSAPGDALLLYRTRETPAAWSGQYVYGQEGLLSAFEVQLTPLRDDIAAMQTTSHVHTPEGSPVTSTSSQEVTVGTVTLAAGTWLLHGAVNVRSTGTWVRATAEWTPISTEQLPSMHSTSFNSGFSGVGFAGVTLPVRLVEPTTPTTYTLKMTGNSDGALAAWSSITAHRLA